MSDVSLSKIENMIYVIRGQKIMLDSDLARLYEIETSQLNRQVRRNLNRFPGDFMFELDLEEFNSLICQNGISKKGRGGDKNFHWFLLSQEWQCFLVLLIVKRQLQ